MLLSVPEISKILTISYRWLKFLLTKNLASNNFPEQLQLHINQ